MQLMTAQQARNQFGHLMNTMQREPVLITKNNRPVGAFVSIEDLKGTHIAEQFIEPSEDYETWAKAKVLNALDELNKNGSQGVSIEEAKKLVRQKFAQRLA